MTQAPHPDDEPQKISHRLRWILAGVGAVVLIAGGIAAWQYPTWRANRSVTMAREWLDAGKLNLAEPAVAEAIKRAPQNPQAWATASDFATRTGQIGNAVSYAAKASDLAPDNPTLALNWATLALLVNDTDSAEKAIQRAPSIDASARAQLLLAELNRLKNNFTQGIVHLENALRLGGPSPEYELPLANALFPSSDPATHERARELYQKYVADPTHGATALRAFLAEAVSTQNTKEATRLATALLAHPAHNQADQDNALLTLANLQPELFREELAKLQKTASSDVRAVDHLLAWLTGYRHHDLAAVWLAALPIEMTSRPPIAVQKLEHLRITQQWSELASAANAGSWSDEFDFIRQAYAAFATQKLGQSEQAETVWRGLRSLAEIQPGRGLFLAGTLYSWGEQSQAIDLWWQASQQAGLALQALGALARHYQATRDPVGSLRAFRQLHRLRANDDALANNYVYFSALLEPPGPSVIELARNLYERNTQTLAYRSNYAFVLLRADRPVEALALLAPHTEAIMAQADLRITYGLVLAANGQRTEARALLEPTSPSLSPAELELIQAALRQTKTR